MLSSITSAFRSQSVTAKSRPEIASLTFDTIVMVSVTVDVLPESSSWNVTPPLTACSELSSNKTVISRVESSNFADTRSKSGYQSEIWS
jgi:hypothetical protein